MLPFREALHHFFFGKQNHSPSTLRSYSSMPKGVTVVCLFISLSQLAIAVEPDFRLHFFPLQRIAQPVFVLVNLHIFLYFLYWLTCISSCIFTALLAYLFEHCISACQLCFFIFFPPRLAQPLYCFTSSQLCKTCPL
jgi:hypothetical protein